MFLRACDPLIGAERALLKRDQVILSLSCNKTALCGTRFYGGIFDKYDWRPFDFLSAICSEPRSESNRSKLVLTSRSRAQKNVSEI